MVQMANATDRVPDIYCKTLPVAVKPVDVVNMQGLLYYHNRDIPLYLAFGTIHMSQYIILQSQLLVLQRPPLNGITVFKSMYGQICINFCEDIFLSGWPNPQYIRQVSITIARRPAARIVCRFGNHQEFVITGTDYDQMTTNELDVPVKLLWRSERLILLLHKVSGNNLRYIDVKHTAPSFDKRSHSFTDAYLGLCALKKCDLTYTIHYFWVSRVGCPGILFWPQ